MDYTVTGAQMKQIDADTINRIGIPSMVLMERAALAVCAAAERLVRDVHSRKSPARILIACGTGNNGADGIAAGRILHGRGYEVTVLLAGNEARASSEHGRQRQIAEQLGVPVAAFRDFVPGDCDVIVDALFGIGLDREITGEYRELISLLKEKRESGAKVVAADIPSGIHADTGELLGIALKADVTVTFGYLKTGLCLFPGKAYAGEVEVADIGFSDASLVRTGWDALLPGENDLGRIPERRADGNKGTFGKVLVIAGSRGMSGAAYLAALAAYRSGAGLVKALTVPENRVILQSQLPEAIVEVYEPEKISGDDASRSFFEEQCDWADVIVMGPGLGQELYVEALVEAVLSHAYVPIVLDADALNCVAAHPHLTRYFTENIIITPHIGEMARLTGLAAEELKREPLRAARAYSARFGVVCVMKDAVTVTSDKEGGAWINRSGCSAMAKAGSGDVLTGVIAGLLARGMECADAAALAVYIHGRAGERAAERFGVDGVLAHNLADCISW